MEASKKHSEATIQIEKDRLTYELIKEWHEDKKLLTYKRQKLGLSRHHIDITLFSNIEDEIKFITYLDNFFDYFLLVYKLINSKKINKDLYFEVLGKEIIQFKEKQLEENTDVSGEIREKLIKQKNIGLSVISDREWFDKIFKIANEEYKFG